MISQSDHRAIELLFRRYSNMIDERQISRIAEVFTPDARYDLEGFGYGKMAGLEAIGAILRRDDVHPLMHITVNIEVEEKDGTVRAFSRCVAILADGSTSLATYHDVLVNTAEGWRIAERVIVPRTPEMIPAES
jgi:3-phenylpropionate/cinnamic acid dioxygenase small subunit